MRPNLIFRGDGQSPFWSAGMTKFIETSTPADHAKVLGRGNAELLGGFLKPKGLPPWRQAKNHQDLTSVS